MGAVTRYLLTLPERLVRATAAGGGGALSESARLLLPRLVRHSRLYDVTAGSALRVAVELVGGVVPPHESGQEPELEAGRLAVKKAAGNVVEIGSIAAFGFSPLWLLAGAADVLNGTRVYLRTLEDELAAHGLLPPGVEFSSVDQLVKALEGTAGNTATMMDLPPLELSELKRSLTELRDDATSLPGPAELARLFNGLVRAAAAEKRSILEVSSGVGLAFLSSARNVGRAHLVTPYREDWAPLAREGFGAYAARVSRPYRQALLSHFDPHRDTLTERLPERTRTALGWARGRLRSALTRRSGPA
ncbi:MAG: hypothetical protein IT299_05955 [Dehalococcoidia bacterium]|nr:hypothetical protein [Dehalococcoidia bacterium]